MKKKGYLFLTVALFMMTILFLQSESKAVMTSWSAEQPPEGAKGVEKRTEYRFRDKSTQTSYSTSLGGWTQAGGSWVASGSGQVDYVSSFPSGFEARSGIYQYYNRAPVAPSETATNKTTVSTSHIGYIYYHWCRNGTYYGNQKNRTVNGVYTDKFWNFHAFFTSSPLGWDSKGAFYGDLPQHCNDTYWWIGYGEGVAANILVYRCSYQQYKKLFKYHKWSKYSDWSASAPVPGSNREIQKRIAYRYEEDSIKSIAPSIVTTYTVKTSTGKSGKNAAKKKVKIRLKMMIIRGFKGYQIQYATNKKMKKSKSIWGKKKSVAISVKRKKIYYIRVRYYKNKSHSKQKVFSKWSKIKRLSVKK